MEELSPPIPTGSALYSTVEGFRNIEEHDVPNVLEAWELDPHFRDTTRAIPMADYVDMTVLSSILQSNDAQPDSHMQFLDNKLSQCNFADSYQTNFDVCDETPKSDLCFERPPLLLKSTHLRLRMSDPHNDASAITNIIEQCLESFHEFDFSFIPSSMTWKGKYLQGCTFCDIRIHLYCEVPSTSTINPSEIQYIIEVCRIQGDPKPFYNFFKEFRSKIVALGGTIASRESSLGTFTLNSAEDDFSFPTPSDFVSEDHFSPLVSSSAHQNNSASTSAPLLSRRFSPSPQTTTVTSPIAELAPCASHFVQVIPTSTLHSYCGEDFIATLTPIITMAESPLYETQLEAARMLWDIAVHQDTRVLGEPCTVTCLCTLLERLVVHTTFHRVREQAVVSLARFLDYPGYASHLIASASPAVWSCLANYVQNAKEDERAYDSAQLRRECAYILATLISFDGNRALCRLLGLHENDSPTIESFQAYIQLKMKEREDSTENGSDRAEDWCEDYDDDDDEAAILQHRHSERDIFAYLQAYHQPLSERTTINHTSASPSVGYDHSSPTSSGMTYHALQVWLRSFDDLKDLRLKAQAIRIRDGLQRILKSNK